MEAILESMLANGTISRGQLQGLIVIAVIFFVIAMGYFLLRLYRIIAGSQKETYVPNIGRKRFGGLSAEAAAKRKESDQ